MAIISVSDITYDYATVRALSMVSFSLDTGSITALVGPNGAGKSTLMRCMAALDTPLEGEVTIDGKRASAHPREVHRIIGYLPDIFGVYDDLTVEQTLIYFAEANGVNARERTEAVARVIALCELQDYAQAKTASLSRGWRQRLGIAQTLVHRPQILLLDEPASGLDPETRHSLSNLLRTLKAEGMCIMVSSHILSELEDYCDRMLILRAGKLVDDTATSALKAGETLQSRYMAHAHTQAAKG
jgi:ABC-2 type transport system ATP-binding protein